MTLCASLMITVSSARIAAMEKAITNAVVVAAVYHTPAHFVAAVDGEAVGRLSDRHAQRP